MKRCFLNQSNDCTSSCAAYLESEPKAATPCRILSAMERLIPPPSRPIAPTAPSIPKVTR